MEKGRERRQGPGGASGQWIFGQQCLARGRIGRSKCCTGESGEKSHGLMPSKKRSRSLLPSRAGRSQALDKLTILVLGWRAELLPCLPSSPSHAPRTRPSLLPFGIVSIYLAHCFFTPPTSTSNHEAGFCSHCLPLRRDCFRTG